MTVADPTLDVESALFASGTRTVIGCDEVGRGAIAGPVAVGLCALDTRALDTTVVAPVADGSGRMPEERRMPEGLRDSKMLSEPRREAMAPLVIAWARSTAVGLATAEEVDRLGITACLGLAGKRALAILHEAGVDVAGSVILLDGHHDWLNPALATRLRVQTQVKADRDCGSVAGASVVAKVHRDRLMIQADAELPGYGWSGNKGYGSAGHLAAIERLGPSRLHRLSWLRTPASEPSTVEGVAAGLAPAGLAQSA